jgi:hypothetical protein
MPATGAFHDRGGAAAQPGPHARGKPGQPRLRSTAATSAAVRHGRYRTSAQL